MRSELHRHAGRRQGAARTSVNILLSYLIIIGPAPRASAQVTTLYGCQYTRLYVDPAPISNEHLGASIAIDGDFNGDGHADLLIGGTAKPTEDSDVNTTRALLFLGDPNGGEPSATAAITFEGNGERDQFGTRVAFLDDMNFDGCDELIIAAPNWPDQYTRHGILYIYLGRAVMPGPGEQPFTAANADVIIQGAQCYGGRLGDALDTGYIDDDNVADILVGSPGSDVTDGVNQYAGVARVFLGGGSQSILGQAIAEVTSNPSSAPFIVGIDACSFLMVGAAESDRFGQSVAIIGNTDGTPGAEFAVGAPQMKMDTGAPRGNTGPGYVRLFNQDGETLTSGPGQPLDLAGVQGSSPETRTKGEAFGFSLAGGVDLGGPNGQFDGINDIIIGAILHDLNFGGQNPVLDAGAVFVYSGADLSPLLIDQNGQTLLEGEEAGDQFGSAVAGIPHTVGTELIPVPDILVGAWFLDKFPLEPMVDCSFEADKAQGGNKAGAFYVVDGATGNLRYKIIGEREKDSLGYAVAGGDLDGDGSTDVLSAGLRWSDPVNEVCDPPLSDCPTEVGRTYLFDNLDP